MINKNLPQGIVGFIIVDGRVAVSVSDFDNSRPGGFELVTAQRKRVQSALGRKFIETYGGPIMSRVLSYDDATDLVRRIYHSEIDGVSYVEELVNYE